VKVVKTKKVYYRLPKIREFQKNLPGLALSKYSRLIDWWKLQKPRRFITSSQKLESFKKTFLVWRSQSIPDLLIGESCKNQEGLLQAPKN
jgi:hypothetical protein